VPRALLRHGHARGISMPVHQRGPLAIVATVSSGWSSIIRDFSAHTRLTAPKRVLKSSSVFHIITDPSRFPPCCDYVLVRMGSRRRVVDQGSLLLLTTDPRPQLTCLFFPHQALPTRFNLKALISFPLPFADLLIRSLSLHRIAISRLFSPLLLHAPASR
jgi:hypothetical protein